MTTETPYQRHPDKNDDAFAWWKTTHPDLERDFLVIADEYRRTRQTLGGVGIMTELKRRYGSDKYKGRNEFGPRIAHWFLQWHPEFTGVITAR
jgi:hypothetical protein